MVAAVSLVCRFTQVAFRRDWALYGLQTRYTRTDLLAIKRLRYETCLETQEFSQIHSKRRRILAHWIHWVFAQFIFLRSFLEPVRGVGSYSGFGGDRRGEPFKSRKFSWEQLQRHQMPSDGHILGNPIATAAIFSLLILPLATMLLRLSHSLLYASLSS